VAEALLAYCTPPPPPPSAEELLTWAPAVMERMRACQMVSEPAAPQTVPLMLKRAPKTDLAIAVNSNQTAEPQSASGRSNTSIVVPRWLAAIVLLLLAALIGWTIYRETHLAGPGAPAPSSNGQQ
jgi:hypothetical protein